MPEFLCLYSKSRYLNLNSAVLCDFCASVLKKKIMILGGGPNRIGQGIEFDYCCCHASYALREQGIESIMVNSNPETVSTDYDTSDKLYFEPLTFEDVMNIIYSLKDDPEFQEILKDPVIMNAVQSGDVNTLRSNEKFLKLLDHSSVEQIKNQMGQ